MKLDKLQKEFDQQFGCYEDKQQLEFINYGVNEVKDFIKQSYKAGMQAMADALIKENDNPDDFPGHKMFIAGENAVCDKQRKIRDQLLSKGD